MPWSVGGGAAAWEPPTDVFETADEYVVRVELAGVDPQRLRISLADRVLIVSGFREDQQPKVGYHRMEIHYGPFETRAVLPRRVDPARVRADYREGLLTVTVAKAAVVRVPVGRVADGSEDELPPASD